MLEFTWFHLLQSLSEARAQLDFINLFEAWKFIGSMAIDRNQNIGELLLTKSQKVSGPNIHTGTKGQYLSSVM